ncbi:MAG: M48 family metallopeptidase [Acidobacteria bacterium]|nr:M48 family metallopeptidase [Acidobacteriota bacterium]
MSTVDGTYHDGQSSAPRPVRVRVADGLVHVDDAASTTAFPLAAVRLEPRLGDLPRRLDLPGGASCVVPAAFELPATASPARVDRWVNDLEVRWAPALVAAVLLLALLWGGIVYGVPVAANIVARRMSPAVERQMGTQALSTLDRVALAPTALDSERQAQLTKRFEQLVQAAAPGAGYTLIFRSSPAIGPNAFALPGGTVVLLDELEKTAQHDDEIAAVLAHEIGHLRERHTMRHVLQTSAAGVLVAAVVGDVLSLSSYAAALPAFLLDARYSRAFEREADDVGFAVMDATGIDRAHFVRFLTRMEKEHGSNVPGFLSTHPRADERSRAAGR